jgi:hypothetical protein
MLILTLTIAQIILAIQLSSPHLPTPRAQAFAAVIQAQPDVEPLETIAIATHESQWNELAISADGADFGLMQIRAQYYGGKKSDLLNGEHNIKVGSYLMKLNKEMCRKFLNREPEFQEYYACYSGACRNKETMCKPTKLSKQVNEYKLCLQDRVNDPNSNKDCRKVYWPEIK